jgi:hypothetical protein
MNGRVVQFPCARIYSPDAADAERMNRSARRREWVIHRAQEFAIIAILLLAAM